MYDSRWGKTIIMMIVDSSPHESHVDGTAPKEGKKHKNDNGNTPWGSRPVCLRIGNSRLGSPVTGSILSSSLIKQAVKHKCDGITSPLVSDMF